MSGSSALDNFSSALDNFSSEHDNFSSALDIFSSERDIFELALDLPALALAGEGSGYDASSSAFESGFPSCVPRARPADPVTRAASTSAK